MTKKPTFEEAYTRLEEILEQMNLGTVSLENSLKLYEEADSLIKMCTERLDIAEQKIQKIMKKPGKEAATDSDGEPILEDFEADNDQVLTRKQTS